MYRSLLYGLFAMSSTNRIPISFRVSPEFKRLLGLAAAQEQRSRTNLLEKLLADHCRAAGLLSPKKHRPEELPDGQTAMTGTNNDFRE